MVSGNSGDTEIKVKEAGNLLRRAEIADSEFACKSNECIERTPTSSSSSTEIHNRKPMGYIYMNEVLTDFRFPNYFFGFCC